MKKQSGFTLIELAIVLVIIGLLLGGVLKGQELINSAKAKNIASDFKNAQIFIYGYQDKFRAVPGDDQAVTTHIQNATRATTPGSTLGNGQIDGNWNSDIKTDESYLFWQHVRMAGFSTGPTSVDDGNYVPHNADGGRLGVQGIKNFATITGMSGLYVVCSENIAGRLAKVIDTSLDDGEPSTGSVRAVVDGNATPVKGVDIVDGNPYTVCMSF